MEVKKLFEGETRNNKKKGSRKKGRKSNQQKEKVMKMEKKIC